MKTGKKDWLVKVAYITEENRYEVKYINILNSTKDEVLLAVQPYAAYSTVRIYKLESIL